MRYGLIPTRFVERIALWLRKVPFPVVDTMLPTMQTRALMSAVKYGVFDALAGGALTAADCAARCGVDAVTLKLTLRVLVAMGYVTEEAVPSGSGQGGTAEPQFALTRTARETLLPGGMDVGDYVRFNYFQWKLVEELDPVLATGKANEFHQTINDPEFWRSYQHAMRVLAHTEAPFLAKSISVARGATRLLDIAGSHGLLGAALCRKHYGLKSTVLDLPAALPFAQEAAQQEDITDVVEHKAGNLLTDDFGSGWDVALYSNIAHHFDFATNVGVLKRVRAALKPGGTFALWDFELPPDGRREGAADTMALYFRIISTAECYSAAQYAAMLREAGFSRVEQKREPVQPVMLLTLGYA
jgi:SAM-dependent methyltransferase